MNLLSKSQVLILKNIIRFHSRQTNDSKIEQIWNKLFGKYLLITNITSSGFLLMSGDIISQEIDYRRNKLNKSPRYDWMRVGRMFVVGCMQIPLQHFFYQWLDKAMPVVSLKTTVFKILLDQVIMAPLCITTFFYIACILERKSLAESSGELWKKFVLVYSVDCCIWPAAQFINFHYLHPTYRVIYVNCVTVLYNIFLSYVKHHDISSVGDFK